MAFTHDELAVRVLDDPGLSPASVVALTVKAAVEQWLAPFRVQASVTGARKTTFVLRHDREWAWVRVRSGLRNGRLPGNPARPWDQVREPAPRLGALGEAVLTARFGDFYDIGLHVCQWAAVQEDWDGRPVPVGKPDDFVEEATDWGINGSASMLLRLVAGLDHGADVASMQVLAGLTGVVWP